MLNSLTQKSRVITHRLPEYPRILVIDDDPEITSLLQRGLSSEGFDVTTINDGAEALKVTGRLKPDLLILDVMMPGMDGLELSRILRETSDVPILMLTARVTVADKIAGLNSGADDYLVKPFDFGELLARIRALLRRSNPDCGDVLEYSDLVMNLATREVSRGAAINLSALEFNLLELLMSNVCKVISRDKIYEVVWSYDFDGESNIVDVYVHYLRNKLNANGRPNLIHTIRGIGYILKE